MSLRAGVLPQALCTPGKHEALNNSYCPFAVYHQPLGKAFSVLETSVWHVEQRSRVSHELCGTAPCEQVPDPKERAGISMHPLWTANLPSHCALVQWSCWWELRHQTWHSSCFFLQTDSSCFLSKWLRKISILFPSCFPFPFILQGIVHTMITRYWSEQFCNN